MSVSSLLLNALLARDAPSGREPRPRKSPSQPAPGCDVTASQPTLPKPGPSARFHFFCTECLRPFLGCGAGILTIATAIGASGAVRVRSGGFLCALSESSAHSALKIFLAAKQGTVETLKLTTPSAFDFPSLPTQNRDSSLPAHPTSGGVTDSTEMLAAKRHAGVHTPVIVGKTIIANQTLAYAA